MRGGIGSAKGLGGVSGGMREKVEGGGSGGGHQSLRESGR